MLHLESLGAPHPLPAGCGDSGLVDFWAEEVGKVLQCQLEVSGERFFIGVACDIAFAGGALGAYDNPSGQVTLPLVGPDQLAQLDPGYEWKIAPDAIRQQVGFAETKKNIHLLGGRVQDAKGTSHFQVKFSGARPWPLDRNVDPVSDAFLRELIPITGYPLSVIKWVLLTGNRVPMPRFRLEAFACSNDQTCARL
jgi:hypothetical protein